MPPPLPIFPGCGPVRSCVTVPTHWHIFQSYQKEIHCSWSNKTEKNHFFLNQTIWRAGNSQCLYMWCYSQWIPREERDWTLRRERQFSWISDVKLSSCWTHPLSTSTSTLLVCLHCQWFLFLQILMPETNNKIACMWSLEAVLPESLIEAKQKRPNRAVSWQAKDIMF